MLQVLQEPSKTRSNFPNWYVNVSDSTDFVSQTFISPFPIWISTFFFSFHCVFYKCKYKNFVSYLKSICNIPAGAVLRGGGRGEGGGAGAESGAPAPRHGRDCGRRRHQTLVSAAADCVVSGGGHWSPRDGRRRLQASLALLLLEDFALQKKVIDRSIDFAMCEKSIFICFFLPRINRFFPGF